MRDHNNSIDNINFSVLDLAVIVEGGNAAVAFKNSLDLAQRAEKWRFKRFWMAEHHNMASVASSATAVLLGYIAGGTSTIKIGSGGIMLPNHAPLIVAEQFGTLASIYPGRIELGLGRAPGTDQTTAAALRRGRTESVQDFPNDIEEIQQYFSEDNHSSKVRAIPGEGLDIPIYILGSSMTSAVLAARLGLPYAFASHFAPTQFKQAIQYYRENFQPSKSLDKPYVISCVNVIAADHDHEASHMATSFYQLGLGIIRGQSYPLRPPVQDMSQLWTEAEAAAIQQMMAVSFIGDRQRVKEELISFIETTQVDEVMVVSHIYDHASRIKSYEIVAEMFSN